MTTNSSGWASGTGLPTKHSIEAAVHVARVIGSSRARLVDTRESYWRRALGGSLSPADLRIGEELLLACNLIELHGDDLVVTGQLVDLVASDADELTAYLCLRGVAVLATAEIETNTFLTELAGLVPDGTRRERIMRGLLHLFDDVVLKEIGDIGEEIVEARMKEELVVLGYPHLAAKVVRVSLFDDTAGYDIWAPSIGGGERLLEVKATTRDEDPISIHVSRNEADTGNLRGDWSLVVCHVSSVENREGEIKGWSTARELSMRFPKDAPDGTWEVARVSIPCALLVPGIPGGVA